MAIYESPDGQFEYIGEDRAVFRCGDIGPTTSGNDLSSPEGLPASVFGIIMLGIDIVSTIAGIVEKPGPYGMLNSPVSVSILAAGTTILIVVLHWHSRCLATELPEFLGGVDTTSEDCLAGVVDGIQAPPDSDGDFIFPFRRQHPSITVVVKNRYWSWFSQAGASHVFCTEDRSSMVVRAFFYDKRICEIMAGSVLGAVIGGALGAWAGYVVAEWVAAVLCALLGPFCALVVVIAATIVAAATTLAGTAAGGGIATAVAGEPLAATWSWNVGQLVKITGPTVNHEEFDGAKVFWFADDESCNCFGSVDIDRPAGGFSHTFPDCALTEFREDGNPIRDEEGSDCTN